MNKPPFFIFIWIIDKDHNIDGGANELMRRVNQYRSAMELLHTKSRCRSSFQMAFDMSTLIAYLRPTLGFGMSLSFIRVYRQLLTGDRC